MLESPVALSSPATTPRRVLGQVSSETSGPTLICIAALHGNEPAGITGLERVLAKLGTEDPDLHGDFLCVVGNRQAVGAGQRYLELDLNRSWSKERVQSLRRTDGELTGEDLEQKELDEVVRQAIADARGPVYVLDIHTTSGPSPAFVVLDDQLTNRAFALHIPVPLVIGLEEELDGTMMHYLDQMGLTTAGFEAGQHEEPVAVERAEAVAWVALAAAGLLPHGRSEVVASANRLRTDSKGLPRAVEIRHRHAVNNGEGFGMEPGWRSFQPVRRNQPLARNDGGPITAPESGRILMPLYQRQGNDGFFIVRPIRPIWLGISAWLRRAGIERYLHWMPGVRRDPDHPWSYIVDRRVARWYALEVFHLLGFRRHGDGGRYLVVSRRL